MKRKKWENPYIEEVEYYSYKNIRRCTCNMCTYYRKTKVEADKNGTK